MDTRIKIILLSVVLAALVFVTGVYVGVALSEGKVSAPVSDRCHQVYLEVTAYEKALGVFRKELPFRLEEGNFDLFVVDAYMDLEYKYYTKYVQYWKECGLKAPILYFTGVGDEYEQCGETLDKFAGKTYVFTVVDANVPSSRLLFSYYDVKEIPTIIVCDKERVTCDEGEIARALEKC